MDKEYIAKRRKEGVVVMTNENDLCKFSGHQRCLYCDTEDVRKCANFYYPSKKEKELN